MRPVTWKSGLAGLALTLGAGLLPSALLLAQSGEVYRVPEPVGVPVRRHRNPKQDGRPFSADYQSAWQEHLAQEREATTLERLHRSEPPTARFTRETAIEAQQRKIVTRQTEMRGQARPAYVVRRGPVDMRSKSLFGSEVKRALPVPGPRTDGAEPRVGGKLAGGTVTAVDVIAEYPAAPARTGLFARVFKKVSPYARHTIVEPVEAEELAASEGEMWADSENHASPQDNEESPEATESDSARAVVQMPESATQAVTVAKEAEPVGEAPRNLEVPLPVPDLPVETAATAAPPATPAAPVGTVPEKSVPAPKVMPAHQTAQGPEKAKRTSWSPAPGVEPDARAATTDESAKDTPRSQVGPGVKTYALPTIPDEVLKKYKAR